MFSKYVYKNHKKLRYGYTTGTCAAAAAKAAARMLLTGMRVSSVFLITPGGTPLTLEILDICQEKNQVSCAVQKDAGDDADQTDGIAVYAQVSFHTKGDILIDGGTGVGRITRPGLDQPIGAAAINSTPRQMIRQAVTEELLAAGYEEGLQIIISAPAGEEIAKKTFNPRLGIEGGISILGTSGIVEPMSEQALIDTIRVEMKQKKAEGEEILIVSPGNYGRNFAKEQWNIDLNQGLKCSNFIGETLDMALELEFQKILFIGHIGKLVKVAAGIMNTHSRMADARLETLCSCSILAGCKNQTAKDILACATTDEALNVLEQEDLIPPVMDILLEKIQHHMLLRTEQKIEIEVIVFSNLAGVLAISSGAEDFIQTIRNTNTQKEDTV